jgi:SlyX protein
VLYKQQQEIERLGSICDALVKRVKELSEFTPGIDAPANEKPPHY